MLSADNAAASTIVLSDSRSKYISSTIFGVIHFAPVMTIALVILLIITHL